MIIKMSLLPLKKKCNNSTIFFNKKKPQTSPVLFLRVKQNNDFTTKGYSIECKKETHYPFKRPTN